MRVDTHSEVVTYTATDTSQSNLVIDQTASVAFHGPVSASSSSVVAAPTSVPDDGTSTSSITVTLTDSSGTPVSGQVVTLGQGAGSSAISGGGTATTNAQGVATFSATDTHSEVVTYTATDTSQSNLVIDQTASVAFHGPVSASSSSVVAAPTSVPDDGTSTSSITVTLTDSSGTPVSGQVVTLGQGAGSSAISGGGTATTNAQGVATFSASDTHSEVVTYTATDTSQSNLVIDQTASVAFHGPVSASSSSVVAAPTSVPDDGTSTSSITVTLTDSSGTPVSGQVVTLGQGAGSSVISGGGTATTNAQGVATFTATDTHSEVVTYTATDTSQSNLVIDQTAQVTFGAGTGPVSQSNSTVTPSPTSVADNGTSASTVTVTLQDGSGNPIPGQTVTLAQSSGGNSVITTVSGVTNAQGQATFSVTDTSSQVVTYTATDVTAGVTLTNTGSVTFHGPVSASSSSVVAAPTSVPDDGTSTSSITVTLTDSSGTPVSGQVVTLGQGAGSSAISGGGTATTNAQGVATFSASDTHSEVVTYTATDTSQSNLVIDQTASVAFHGPVSASSSSVVAAPTSVPDDGTSASTVTVTLKDGSGTPVSGQVVTLGQGAGSSVISGGGTATTNAQGVATFTATDTHSEVVTYTATDTSQSNLVIDQTASVAFHGPVSASSSSVVAAPTSVPDDGTSTSSITVTLTDSSGTPVSGQVVTLGQGAGSSAISGGGTATTNAQGVATFSASDTHSEVVTYTATDTSQSNLVIDQTASVAFHGPVSASSSSVVAAPTSVPDDGTSTSSITVTLTVVGTPVSGQVVTLGQGAAAPRSSPPSR